MAAKNEARIRFVAETSEFNNQIKQANQSMTELRSELRLSQTRFRDNADSVEALTEKKRILQQQLAVTADKVQALRQKLERAKAIYGENSTEVSRLRTQLNNAERQYFETENAINDVNQALNRQETESEQTTRATKDLNKAVDDAGEGFTVFKGVVANVAATAIMAAASAVGELVSGLWNLADETRELRAEMGKLDAAFIASGHSTETAADTYETLYSIIGETDQSVEAAQQIALLANNTKDAADWADLAAGVVGRFGDALQPETFFEAANETMKLGEATGAYVQMLEGTGMSVEEFNEGLAAATTEEEKQAYMLEVTREALGAAGEEYKKNNAEIIDATKTQSKYNNALAGLGETIEPVKTKIVSGMADMLASVNAFLNGDISASELIDQLKDVVSEGVEGLRKALPKLAEVGGEMILSLIDGIISSLPDILECAADIITGLLDGLTENVDNLFSAGGELIDNLSEGILSAVPKIADSAMNLVDALGQGIADNSESLASKALDLVNGLVDHIAEYTPLLIENGIGFIKNLIQGIMSALPTLLEKIPEIITKLVMTIASSTNQLIAGGGEIIGALIVGIIKAIPKIIASIPKVIASIVSTLFSFNWKGAGEDISEEIGEGIANATAVITPFKEGLEGLTPAIANVSELTSAMGRTMSAVESEIGTAEGNITFILQTAMEEQRQLRADEIASIEQYNAEIARLEQEKLQIYRKNQQIELSAILAEGERMTQESMQQHLVNLEQALNDANTATDASYQAQLADLYSYYEAQGKVNSDEHIAAIQELQQWRNEELAINQTHYDEGYNLLLQNSARTVEGDMAMWNQLYENSNEGARNFVANLDQMDLDSAEAFLSMWTTAKQAGTDIPAETDQMALDILESFANLPDNLQTQGAEALNGLIGGMVDELPALENASDMTASEIVDTIKKDLQIKSPSRVLQAVGADATQGLINGMSSKERTLTATSTKISGAIVKNLTPRNSSVQSIGENIMTGINSGMNNRSSWLGGKISSLASGIVSRFKNAFDIHSPSRLMRDAIGAEIVEGIGVGIAENTGAVTEPINSLLRDVRGIDVAGEWDKLSGAGGSLNYDVSAQLGDYVSSAIDTNSPYALLGSLIDAVEDLASRPIDFNVDGYRFATATAGASDNVSGTRLNLKTRGLAL